MRLQDKTALITGGGRGIALAAALLMLSEGARVGIVEVNEAHAQKAVETARAILFLASDEANFFTGQVLLVDGGFSLK